MIFLSRLEELVLLAIWKINEGAYGVNTRNFLSDWKITVILFIGVQSCSKTI